MDNMLNVKKIGAHLLTPDLIRLITITDKIKPINYAHIANNTNPDNLQYAIINDDGHEGELYYWNTSLNKWSNVYAIDPTKYTKEEIDALVEGLTVSVDEYEEFFNQVKLDEVVRQEYENIRQSNEDVRISNEELRQLGYENIVITVEEVISSESIRQSNEDERIINEDIRIANEEARNIKDVEYTSNENTRKQNELVRQSNEDVRIQNEIDREERFNEMIVGDSPTEVVDARGGFPTLKARLDNSDSVKVDKVAGKQLSTEDYTTDEKNKLANIEEGANKYIHPSTHSSDMIVDTPDKRFVSDSKISEWDAKETVEGAQAKANHAEANAYAYIDDEINRLDDKINIPEDVEFSGHGSIIPVHDAVVDGKADVVLEGLTASNMVQDISENAWAPSGNTSNFTISNNIVTYTGLHKSWGGVISSDKQFYTNHKYYIKADIKSDDLVNSTGNTLGIYRPGHVKQNPYTYKNLGQWDMMSTIITSDIDGVAKIRLRTAGVCTVNWKKPICVDLTKSFGAGNEPTKEECDQIFSNYFDGTKSTIGATRIKSVGKNLFDGKLELGNLLSTGVVDNPLRMRSKNFTRVEPNTTYTVSIDKPYSYQIFLYDTNKNYLSFIGNPTSITTPPNCHYIKLKTISDNQNDLNTKIQIEEGAVATPYEPYKEDISYILAKQDDKIVNLRSLPNGVRDEIRDGKLIKRVSDNALSLTNGWEYRSKSNDGNFHIISKDSGYLDMFSKQISGLVTSGEFYLSDRSYEPYLINSISLIQSANKKLIAKFHTSQRLYISIPNAEYNQAETDIGANAWALVNLVNHTLTYQLAEPEIIPIQSSSFNVYKGGQIEVDNIIPEIGFYIDDEISTHYPAHPIGEVTDLYIVDKDTGVQTPLDVSKCIISEDKLSFTHPDLANGDLVDWDYSPEGTYPLPKCTFKAPTNVSSSVSSLLKDSSEKKRDIKQLSNQLLGHTGNDEVHVTSEYKESVTNQIDAHANTIQSHLVANNPHSITPAKISAVHQNDFVQYKQKTDGQLNDIMLGIIVESGENENGRYMKYGNGIMICLGYKEFNVVLDQPWGSLYGAQLGRLTFPKPYAIAPYVVPGTYKGNSVFITTSSGANYAETPIYWAYQAANVSTERIIGLNYIAIGMWK